MNNIEIEVFHIGKTSVDRKEVRRWLDHIGAEKYDIPDESICSDPALLVALAAKRCYMSYGVGINKNVTKVRSDIVEYVDNILASGHGSVCENSVHSFAIEGVSRVFTAEMNRHRAGWAISEGSLRFIRFDSIPYWVPLSLRANPDDDDDLRLRKSKSREIFERAFKNQEQEYAELLEIWNMDSGHHNFSYKKKVTSCLRRIVGMGVATGGVWTGNLRALRHVVTMRASAAAEEEIYHVFCDKIFPIMLEKEPLFFSDFSMTDQGLVPKYKKV